MSPQDQLIETFIRLRSTEAPGLDQRERFVQGLVLALLGAWLLSLLLAWAAVTALRVA
jgi:hypothetical protein